jgi:hypothetical protein
LLLNVLKIWEFVGFCVAGEGGGQISGKNVTYYMDDPYVELEFKFRKTKIKLKRCSHSQLDKIYFVWMGEFQLLKRLRLPSW